MGDHNFLIGMATDRFLDNTEAMTQFMMKSFTCDAEWEDAEEMVAGLNAVVIVNVETPDECMMVVVIPSPGGEAVVGLHLCSTGCDSGGVYCVKVAAMTDETVDGVCAAVCMLLPEIEIEEDSGLMPDDEANEDDDDLPGDETYDNVPQPDGLPVPNTPAAIPRT